MKMRTTLVLAVVALAMAAYIYFHERHTLSQAEVEGRGTHLVQRFVRARLSSVEVQRHGTSWTIERIPGADDAEDLHVYRIAAPVRDAADDEAVNALLGSIEWTDARRTLVNVSSADRNTYGLLHPRLRAVLRVANETIHLAFGAEVPGGQGVYASLDDPHTVYVVGKDFFEAFDFDLAHFRSKSFFDGRSAAGAVRITLRNEFGSVVLDRPDGHQWWVREPVAMHAASAAVDAILNSFESAQAESFVDESAANLSRYGLSPAVVDVRATMSAPDGGAGASMRIRLGNVCEGRPNEVYALVDDAPPVVCVVAESFAALRVSRTTLNENHLLVTPDESVERVSVSRGSASLRVSRTDDGWKFAANGAADAPADEAAVARLVADLRALVVADTSDQTNIESVVPIAADQLRAFHLDPPLAEISITKTEGRGLERVLLGQRGSQYWVRRGDEPVAFLVDEAVAHRFDPSPIYVRSLDVVHEDDARVTSFEVTRHGQPAERVEKSGEQWRVTAPVAVPAERAQVVALLRRFATLRAERFVAATRELGFGGTQSELGLAVTFVDSNASGSRTRRLQIARTAAGVCVASIDDDPSVFEISEDLVAEAQAHFAGRDLLATDIADIESVTVERGRSRTVLSATDANRASAIFQAMPLLHASRTLAYSGDLGPLWATVTVQRRAGGNLPGNLRLRIGAESGEGDAATVRVMREDMPVVFELPAGNVRALFDVAPAP